LRFSRRGFSVIEVIVAIGILMLVLGAISATTLNFAKSMSRLWARADAKEFVSSVTKYLLSSQGCQNSLVSLPIPGATETNFTIVGFGGYGHQIDNISAGYNVTPRLVIDSMTIKNKGSAPSISVRNGVQFQRSVAQIKIVMRTSSATGSVPIREYFIEVPILQKITPITGVIDGCSVDMSVEDACSAAGGTYTAPGTCTPSVSCEFKGTAYGCWPEASCPSTNYPAASKYTFSSASETTSPPTSMCPVGAVPTSSGTVSYTYLGNPCDKYGVCTTYTNQAFFYICLKCN